MTEPIKVGMKFGTFGDAYQRVQQEEGKKPRFGGQNNPNYKTLYIENTNGNSVSYSGLKNKPDKNGNISHVRAQWQGLQYGADSKQFYNYKNIKDLDNIMHTPFTKIVNHEQGKYAEDRNRNGIVDKNEIFDINW